MIQFTSMKYFRSFCGVIAKLCDYLFTVTQPPPRPNRFPRRVPKYSGLP